MKASETHYIKRTPNIISDFFYYSAYVLIGVSCFFATVIDLRLFIMGLGLGFLSFPLSHLLQTKTLTPWNPDPVSEWPELPMFSSHYKFVTNLQVKIFHTFSSVTSHHIENFKKGSYNIRLEFDRTFSKINVHFNSSENPTFILKYGNYKDEHIYYVYNQPIFILTIQDKNVAFISNSDNKIHYKILNSDIISEDKIVKLLNTGVLDAILIIDEKLSIIQKNKLDEDLALRDYTLNSIDTIINK